MQQITRNLYQISLGGVNVFVLEDNGLTLIDTGHPSSADKIFAAIQKGGKNPQDINNIILTHCHPDHAGSAAEIKRRTRARTYAHPQDANLMERGSAGRLTHLTPGIVNWLVYQFFVKNAGKAVAPVVINQRVQHLDTIPIAGGITVIHSPGHSAGHIALLLPKENVLIAGDICAHVLGLGFSTVYEDFQAGQRSIQKVADFAFDTAVFGHGAPLKGRASQQLAEKFCA